MKGFTLIELMVAMVIMGLVVSGGVWYLSGSVRNRKIESTKSGLVGVINLARDLAKTRQKPVGYGSEIQRVTLTLADGTATWKADGATTYDAKKIVADDSIIVTMSSPTNWGGFVAGEGKLIKTDGSSVGIGETVNFIITTIENSSEQREIYIDSLGVVHE